MVDIIASFIDLWLIKMYNEIKYKLRKSFVWGMRRNLMDMQLFLDFIMTVINVVINLGYFVAVGLIVRYLIVKSKR